MQVCLKGNQGEMNQRKNASLFKGEPGENEPEEKYKFV